MADYPISNVTRRVVYAASGVGPYAFTFEILAQTDVAVFKDDTLLTLTTDYTVVINANGTGTITLTVVPTGATQIAIVGARAIERISDFTTGGDFFANTVNQELDSITIFAQQNAEAVARALQAPQTDPTTIDMTLPRASVRADKYLSFDVDGNPVAAEGRTEVAGVFAIRDEIVAVAAIDTDVVTVAGIDANVTTVAGIAANVTTVAGISASVTAVAADATDIGTVAANLAGADTIGTVAAIDADITAVAAIDTDVTAVAADATDIGTVAANLAGADTIGTVAGSIANVNLTGGSIANVNTAATNIANINTVATSISNVNAVGTNIAAVNTNATNIAAIQTASANATAAANSATASAASASAASDSADAAATSAETAAAATNAVLWVSGTTYAISFLVYSPLDNRVYRRLTAGAGTTDPSADATNWVQLTRVVEQSDIGTAPNEVPLNQYLGALAYVDTEYPQVDIGTGITSGTGTICKANAGSVGGVYKMTVLIDLTGLNSGGTAGDIIGVNGTALPCYIARLPTMTVLGGRMTCLEAPAGGDDDIDLYSAAEGTGVEDSAITALTETQIINGGTQSAGTVTYFAADPSANHYFYLVGQSTSDATYTAGRFLIEVFGV
jgi:hypothetical protein